ncbi:MAG: molybdopterin-dependent oxidoreductase [Acidobacteriota bacterium]
MSPEDRPSRQPRQEDSSAKGLSRRDFVRLAGGVSFGLATGALSLPILKRLADGGPQRAAAPAGKIDYTRATAKPTICFGCTTHCGVIGWVQDGRVRRIEGNPLDPNSKGKICAKANGMIAYTYYPERLLYPLERVGRRGEGRWKRITWDQALDKIADRLRPLRENGTPERFVFQYGRDKTKGFTSRFTNAFGTPNRLNRRSICSSNRRVPLMSFYGRDFEWETQDFEETRFILNFGGNPMEAYQGGFYMMPRIQQARVDHGARMVTFEVRPSATASVSDEYFQIAPATDGVVALAMANVLIEEDLVDHQFWSRWVNVSLAEVHDHIAHFTPPVAAAHSGIPAEDIRRLAIEFGKAAPRCCTLSNRGSAKHYNGVQTDRAIRLLDVLVGNVGKPGGFCLSTLRGWNRRYGQDDLPVISQPAPKPPKPQPWKPGTRQFESLPEAVQRRVAAFPEEWQNTYFGELATPSEFPLSWHWYNMRVGQLVPDYIRQGVQPVDVFMSYSLGAAYSFPEAGDVREVFLDEGLIPFHVAIDIGYGEQTALADIVLPDATSLERWDAHSTNNYGLVPYTGIRQPLVEPLGEARPLQIILRDLARRIGGGMEQYFDFEDVEDYYREWYSQVPIAWEELKRRGIWQPPGRAKDYELYERPVAAEKLADSRVDPATGLVYDRRGGKEKVVGIEQDGRPVQGFPTPSRKIQVLDEIFPRAAAKLGIPLDDPVADPLPSWFPVPGLEGLPKDRLILTSFKWNVHTQGRSSHLKYQAEIVHTNPLFMSPETGRRLGLESGDEVEVTVYRPQGRTYRAGETEPVGSFRNQVRLLAGVHPQVIACAHHGGHWEHGAVARGEHRQSPVAAVAGDPQALADRDLPANIWWSRERGGTGTGHRLNDALPINPSPMVGGQNWYDNVCSLRKV